MNLDNDGTGDELTLVRRHPNDPEFLDLDAKIGKSGIEEVKTLHINEPTILDLKEFNYDNCSLIDCISLLQPVLNSPHAYSQNMQKLVKVGLKRSKLYIAMNPLFWISRNLNMIISL